MQSLQRCRYFVLHNVLLAVLKKNVSITRWGGWWVWSEKNGKWESSWFCFCSWASLVLLGRLSSSGNSSVDTVLFLFAATVVIFFNDYECPYSCSTGNEKTAQFTFWLKTNNVQYVEKGHWQYLFVVVVFCLIQLQICNSVWACNWNKQDKAVYDQLTARWQYYNFHLAC